MMTDENIPRSDMEVGTCAEQSDELSMKWEGDGAEFTHQGDQQEKGEQGRPDRKNTAALFYEQLESGQNLQGDNRGGRMLGGAGPEGDVANEGPTAGVAMDSAEMCYDSVLLPTLPSEGSHLNQETRMESTETYLGSIGEREGELLVKMAEASSPCTFFQASNMDVDASAAVAASWEDLHSTHEESGYGRGPSSSDDASPDGGNSTEERAFVESLCEEPVEEDDPSIMKIPSLLGPAIRGTKSTRVETIQSSDPENEYSSLLTTDDVSHAEGERTTCGAHQWEEKVAMEEISLRSVLTDPITGAFMDDAMVAMCGHSFGGGGLHRVTETHSCMNCGANVPFNSLVPNLALRAAIMAYKHEDHLWQLSPMKGTKRRKEQFEHPEDFEAKKSSKDHVGPFEHTYSDSSRPGGVQFPFAVSDRVLIKGNKRTLERLVGREAVITSQCLNGWYLVRTLDTGESVRLQYRSLQKLGEMELPFTSEAGHFTEQRTSACCGPIGLDSPRGYQSICNAEAEFPEEMVSLTSNQKDAVDGSAYPVVAVTGLQAGLSEKESNAAFKQPVLAVAARSDPTLNGVTRNSSQELLGDQVGRNTNVVEVGNNPPYTADKQALDARPLRGPVAGALDTVRGRSRAAGKELSRTRSKRTILHVKSCAFSGAFLKDPDPYRKVYTSGSRRQAGRGESVVTVIPDHMLADNKTLMTAPNSMGEGSESTHFTGMSVGVSGTDKLGRQMELTSASEILQFMKKDMLKIEKQIPRNYLLSTWSAHRANWQKHVKASQKVAELGAQIRVFRFSLLLTMAGGMSDEEWQMRIESVLESGDVGLLVSLWESLYCDVNKCLGSRPKFVKSNIIQLGRPLADEIQDWQKENVSVSGHAISAVQMTTAATLAVVDAVAVGQQDPDMSIKALLSSTINLLKQQSRAELSQVRETLDREKRHIAAKLAHLEQSFSRLRETLGSSQVQVGPNPLEDLLRSSQTVQGVPSMAPVGQTIINLTPCVSTQGYETEEHDTDTELLTRGPDGDATDMSDSD